VRKRITGTEAKTVSKQGPEGSLSLIILIVWLSQVFQTS
jgi:hypothetical protein